MRSVSGIYDGKTIIPTEKIGDDRPYRVIITFVEKLEDSVAEDEALRAFGMQDAALDFWQNEAEDIYQDYLPGNKAA